MSRHALQAAVFGFFTAAARAWIVTAYAAPKLSLCPGDNFHDLFGVLTLSAEDHGLLKQRHGIVEKGTQTYT